MPITQEQYSKRADETIPQYTARIAALRNEAPSVAGETPAGELPSLKSMQTTAGPLSNLRQALRMAAEEAGKERVAGRLEQLQGAGLGKTPGTLGSLASIIRGSVQPRVEQTFSDTMTAYNEEQKRQETKKTSALNMMNTMIDNGVFPDTPAGTLLAWEKEAGLPEGTALAWQARLKIARDKSEEKGELEMQLLRKELADKSASSVSPFINVMQNGIDAGVSPEEAAQAAATASEAIGVSVDQKTLNAWTEQARKLVKKPTPPPAPVPVPITAREAGKATKSTIEYMPQAVYETLSGTQAKVLQTTGNFFSGLFGL